MKYLSIALVVALGLTFLHHQTEAKRGDLNIVKTIQYFSKCNGKTVKFPPKLIASGGSAALTCQAKSDDYCMMQCVFNNYKELLNDDNTINFKFLKDQAEEVNLPEATKLLELFQEECTSAVNYKESNPPDSQTSCPQTQDVFNCFKLQFDNLCKEPNSETQNSKPKNLFLASFVRNM